MASLLVVEDDPAVKKMLQSVLVVRGYQVVVANDRTEALEILEQDLSIQCVIQDLGLPPFPDEMASGLETMRDIIRLYPWLKVIVLTGRGKQEAAHQAIKEGAFDFFEKPVALEKLVDSIERALMFIQAEQKLKTEGLYTLNLHVEMGEKGLKPSREQFEAQLIRQVLLETQQNLSEAARKLGLKREGLYYLIKKYGIDSERAEALQ
jgi:DNA-binding NtrC family response regulator